MRTTPLSSDWITPTKKKPIQLPSLANVSIFGMLVLIIGLALFQFYKALAVVVILAIVAFTIYYKVMQPIAKMDYDFSNDNELLQEIIEELEA